MRTDKIQLDILKHLLKDPQTVAVQNHYNEVAVSVDNGVTFYRMPDSLLDVRLRNVRTTVALHDLLDADLRDMTKLTPTDHYRHGGDARKYLFDGLTNQPIYVNPAKLAYFENPTLYAVGRYKPHSVIIAVVEHPFGNEDEPKICGYTMPVKVDEETEE